MGKFQCLPVPIGNPPLSRLPYFRYHALSIYRLSIPDVTNFRRTCELSPQLLATSIEILEFVGSRILMSMDSRLSLSRSPMLCHLSSTNSCCSPTQLSHRNIAFRDSKLQEFLTFEIFDAPNSDSSEYPDMCPK
jgi:hypothetical protein